MSAACEIEIHASQNAAQREQSCQDLTALACGELLIATGIRGTVTEQLSSVDDEYTHNCTLERSIKIVCFNLSKDVLAEYFWPALQTQFHLECVFVSTPSFKGCIFNYLRPSVCPVERRRALRAPAPDQPSPPIAVEMNDADEHARWVS